MCTLCAFTTKPWLGSLLWLYVHNLYTLFLHTFNLQCEVLCCVGFNFVCCTFLRFLSFAPNIVWADAERASARTRLQRKRILKKKMVMKRTTSDTRCGCREAADGEKKTSLECHNFIKAKELAKRAKERTQIQFLIQFTLILFSCCHSLFFVHLILILFFFSFVSFSFFVPFRLHFQNTYLFCCLYLRAIYGMSAKNEEKKRDFLTWFQFEFHQNDILDFDWMKRGTKLSLIGWKKKNLWKKSKTKEKKRKFRKICKENIHWKMVLNCSFNPKLINIDWDFRNFFFTSFHSFFIES